MAGRVARLGKRFSGSGEGKVKRLGEDGGAIFDGRREAGTRRAPAFGWGKKEDEVEKLEDIEYGTEDEVE